jgi:hypothetical protein
MMQIETMAQEKFDSVTMQVPTPDGTMFVTIMESEKGLPVGIQVHIGKAGAPLAAWSNAISRIMTLALDKGATINDLIEELSGQTSDKARMTTNGESVRSGVEGVWVCLIRYKRDKFELVSRALGDVDGRGRGGRLGR